MNRRDPTPGRRVVGKYAGGNLARSDNARTAADRRHQNIMATAPRSNAADSARTMVPLQAVAENAGAPPQRALPDAGRRNEATLAATTALRCATTAALADRWAASDDRRPAVPACGSHGRGPADGGGKRRLTSSQGNRRAAQRLDQGGADLPASRFPRRHESESGLPLSCRTLHLRRTACPTVSMCSLRR